MTTGSNLLFPSKDIDSAMREKFPVILMEYVELENEKKHTTEEGLDRYKGEIWETPENHQYVC